MLIMHDVSKLLKAECNSIQIQIQIFIAKFYFYKKK